MTRILVLGGGAWGTALAQVAASRGHAVTLWMRDATQAADLGARRVNDRFLPGIPLHDGIRATAALSDGRNADIALLVTPAQATREVAATLGAHLRPDIPLVLCAKGLERGTARLLTDVVAEARPGAPVAVLSGPSFAADVARGLPTAVTLACADASLAATLATALSTKTFRVYHRTDVRGVEIGGAAKNVLAIACGAVMGLGLGESAKAALIARGFAELMRLALKLGAERETLMGLSGLGDLVLTASSAQSRNFAFGERLGRGVPLDQAAGGRLVEGALTAPVLVDLARREDVEMPIAAAVEAVVAGRLTLAAAIDALLDRPLKAEE